MLTSQKKKQIHQAFLCVPLKNLSAPPCNSMTLKSYYTEIHLEDTENHEEFLKISAQICF